MEAAAGAADRPKPPVLTPTRFEALIVRYPCLCCWLWFGFSMFLTLVAVVQLNTETLKFDANGVWDVRNNELQSQYDAFVQAREAFSTNESELPHYKARSQPMFPLHIVYFSEDGQDLLDKEILAWARGIEDKLMAATGISSHCQIVMGVDANTAPLAFASLDPSTGAITVTGTAPSNGTELLFTGNSSVLEDGGQYVAYYTDSNNAFGLYLRDAQGRSTKVELAAGAITSGQFFTVIRGCTSMQSVTNYAFPAPEDQEQAMCDGAFVRSTTRETDFGSVSVFDKICGCGADSPVYGSESCGAECAGDFGLTSECTSPSHVTGSTTATQAEIDSKLVKFCPDWDGLSSGEERIYKAVRQQLLPTSFSCSGTADMEAKKNMRSVLWIGGPVEGYTRVAGETVSDQVNDLMEWAAGTTDAMGNPKGDGLLTAVEKIQDEANEEMEGKASVVIMGSFMMQAAYYKMMAMEGIYAVGSLVFVWCWIWCATGSALLATCGIFEAAISLPMSMATWSILGQKYVGFLCIMMIFVILGIGADDVFILYDAWKQSGQLGFTDETQRFAWAYRRAGSAMSVTTATTIFCFLAAGFGDVPSISGFGFFAALVVWWDFFMVMTFFASALMVYYNHFWKKNLCCMNKCCTGHMCCCPCTCIQYDEERPLWRQWKITVPFTVLVLLGIICIIANVLILGGICICCAIVYIHAQLSSSVTDDDSKSRPIEAFCENNLFPVLEAHARKFMLLFFLLVVTSFVAVGVGLRLPTENAKFLKDDNPIQKYFDSSADYTTAGGDSYMYALHVVFGMKKDEALNRDGVDYQQPGSSWSNPVPEDDLGVVQYHEGAKQTLFSDAGQNEVLALCDDLRHERSISNSDENCEMVVYKGVGYPRHISDPAALVASGVLREMSGSGDAYYVVQQPHELTDAGDGFCDLGVYCFMYDVRNYLLHFCDPASGLKEDLTDDSSEYADLCLDDSGSAVTQAFPAEDLNGVLTSEGYQVYRRKVSRLAWITDGMAYADYNNFRHTGVGVDNGEFRFAWIGINASFPRGLTPHGEQVELYDRFDAYFDSKLVVNSQAFMCAFMFTWMVTVEALLRNTIQSVVMATLFCWFVLILTTWNYLIGTIALFAVVCIVACAAGMMVALGWSLGIIESIACIVIIGVSVDYSVHMAHAYNVAQAAPESESKVQQRKDKAKKALGIIGISLVSGCITSLGSTLFLMFCQINFNRYFGMFLFITLCISFLVAFLYLVPVLIVFGPGTGQGQLPLSRCVKRATAAAAPA